MAHRVDVLLDGMMFLALSLTL